MRKTRGFISSLVLALAVFAGAFPVGAQQAAQWNYSFDASGNAWARYPGGVTVGSPTGGSLGVGSINATGIFINGVAVGGGASPANPTASLGLSAVNGVASTYMRSDAAPALSQSIVPTWTGIHTFSATPVFNAGFTVTNGTYNGTPVIGTPANWRTALGLGTMAQQNASAVAITGGTIGGLSAPLGITSGGTGVTTGPGSVLVSQGTFTTSGGPSVAMPATYKQYRLIIWQTQNTAGGFPGLQFSYDNAATWKTGAGDYKYSVASSAGDVTSTTDAHILIGSTQSVSATIPAQIDCLITLQLATGLASVVSCKGQQEVGGGSYTYSAGGYTQVVYGLATNVRWVPSAGTVSGGYALYGIPGF